MARTTAAEVQEILKTPTDGTLTDAMIDAYIIGANVVVTKELGTDSSITATHKAEIERWLTAHMIVSSNRLRLPIKAGGGPVPGVTYVGKYETALDSTPYGQMVKVLDTTGKLAALGGRQVKVTAIPTS